MLNIILNILCKNSMKVGYIMAIKLLNALAEIAKTKDNTPMEKLEYNRVRSTIEDQCEKYLQSPDDIYQFEALPSAIDATLACLEGKQFLEKYEFSQISETCFVVRLKELDIL
jgi:pterin-4a-carbinolamine dehydratase